MKIAVTLLALMLVGSPIKLMAQHSDSQRKILITYFTLPERDGIDASTGASRIIADGALRGTTQHVAMLIANATGGTVHQIKSVHTYPSTHKELVEYAKKEANSKTSVKIQSKIDNFAQYDLIFVGYPNWWYDMPRVIYTLFDEYDFSGKTIIPFCTHGGSGFSESIQTIRKLEPGAKVLPIPAISRDRAERSEEALKDWLRKQGFIKR